MARVGGREAPAVLNRDGTWTPAANAAGPTLFDLPEPLPAFQRGSPTSKAQAQRVARSSNRQREAVRAFIAQQGSYGATQREIAAALGIPRASVCPRVRELEGWAKYPVLIQKTVRVRERCAVYVTIANST